MICKVEHSSSPTCQRTDPPGRTSCALLLRNTSFAGSKPCGISDGPASGSELGISPSTVIRTLHRLGLSRIKDIDPLPPPRCYEPSRPGEMIHIDIKKLARFKAPTLESSDGTPACTEAVGEWRE